jgi:hypothetical protein
MLQDFVCTRRSGLVFCEKDGSQISQRDVLKYSLHPILMKLELEQGALLWRQPKFPKRYSTPGRDMPERTCRNAIKSCFGSVSGGAWNGHGRCRRDDDREIHPFGHRADVAANPAIPESDLASD